MLFVVAFRISALESESQQLQAPSTFSLSQAMWCLPRCPFPRNISACVSLSRPQAPFLCFSLCVEHLPPLHLWAGKSPAASLSPPVPSFSRHPTLGHGCPFSMPTQGPVLTSSISLLILHLSLASFISHPLPGPHDYEARASFPYLHTPHTQQSSWHQVGTQSFVGCPQG